MTMSCEKQNKPSKVVETLVELSLTVIKVGSIDGRIGEVFTKFKSLQSPQ